MQLGVIPNESHDLQQATDELIDSLQRGNPAAAARRAMRVRDVIGGRNALTVDMRNVSEVNRPPGARLALDRAACATAACSTSSPSRRRRKGTSTPTRSGG